MTEPIRDTFQVGDALEVLRTLPGERFHCCVTSPPYWGLRDYGTPGQLGVEDSPEGYVEALVTVLAEVRRVLREDGTLWLNLGDSYAGQRGGSQGINGQCRKRSNAPAREQGKAKRGSGLKRKDLVGIPWRVALALQVDGWYLRSDIIWAKPNPTPENVADRPTRSHEYLFLLSKSERYHYDAEAIKEPVSGTAHPRGNGVHPKAVAAEPGVKANADYSAAVSGLVERRNKRDVWTVATQPYGGEHFSVFPPKLIEPCILAGCPPGGTVLDPFLGSGTTAQVAESLGRHWHGIELNPEYEGLIKDRTRQPSLLNWRREPGQQAR